MRVICVSTCGMWRVLVSIKSTRLATTQSLSDVACLCPRPGTFTFLCALAIWRCLSELRQEWGLAANESRIATPRPQHGRIEGPLGTCAAHGHAGRPLRLVDSLSTISYFRSCSGRLSRALDVPTFSRRVGRVRGECLFRAVRQECAHTNMHGTQLLTDTELRMLPRMCVTS